MTEIMNRWKVCIRCSTYNHSLYVAETLDGFVSQRTDFPFVAVIVDDASTDGEQQVLMNYLSNHFEKCELSSEYDREDDEAVICFARHKVNRNCYFSVVLLKSNHDSKKQSKHCYYSSWQNDSKYVALCEGDDYWIDSNKLQQQVNFLEANLAYSMCFHNAKFNYETESRLRQIIVEDRDYTAVEAFNAWIIPTASILAINSVFKNSIEDKRIINSDIWYVLSATSLGKIRGMSSYMSVYRIHSNGLTIRRQKENMLLLQYKYVDHYKSLFTNFPQITHNCYSSKMCDVYMNIGVIYLRRRNIVYGLYYLIKSIIFSPRQFINRINQYFKRNEAI